MVDMMGLPLWGHVDGDKGNLTGARVKGQSIWKKGQNGDERGEGHAGVP